MIHTQDEIARLFFLQNGVPRNEIVSIKTREEQNMFQNNQKTQLIFLKNLE